MICIARNKTFYHNFYFWPGPFHSLKSGHGNRRFVSSGRIISDIYKQTSWQVKQGLVIRPFLIIVQLNSISICLPISISLICAKNWKYPSPKKHKKYILGFVSKQLSILKSPIKPFFSQSPQDSQPLNQF